MRARRLTRGMRSLRLRVPLTAMAVLLVSLMVASVLAYELLLRDGRRDIDVVLEREHERFARSVAELFAEARADGGEATADEAFERAVRRYLELNPSTESYWTIVTLSDGRRLAASNGPPQLEPLFSDRRLPTGALNVRETIDTDTPAGEIRTSSVPVGLDGRELATLQLVAPLGPERADAREAALLVAAAAGVSLLLGGVLLSATLWRALAPLGALAGAARATEMSSTAGRVRVPEGDDEVATLAREFNTMLDRLDLAAQQQREFMASIGHELRTPLTIARGHLEVLSDARRDPELADTVAIVREELGRTGRLVDDLMAIARADMDEFVRLRDVDLVAWFEDLELRVAGMGAAERVRIEPPPPVLLLADPDRLAQAVLNLVANAVQHTPAGTPVRVSASREEERIAISVVDTGPGIPPHIRENVFAPFVRAGELPSSTGLGLSVVRAVTEAHGGEVELESDGAGTRVTLLLPLAGTGTGGDVAEPLDAVPEGAPRHGR